MMGIRTEDCEWHENYAAHGNIGAEISGVRLGDVVVWDNRCVMHYAVHDYGDAPREMHRVTVRGERPV